MNVKKVKKEIFRGLTAVFSFFMVFIIFGTTIALQIPSTINSFLGITSTVEIVDSGESSENTTYYPTGAESDDVYDQDALNALEKSVADENIATEEEGAVLLQNDNNALPLEAGRMLQCWEHPRLITAVSETWNTMMPGRKITRDTV